MEYLIRPTNNDILHRSHKYIERVKTSSGKWRYIYKKYGYDKNIYGAGVAARKAYKKQEKATKKAQKNLQSVIQTKEQHRQQRLNSDPNNSHQAYYNKFAESQDNKNYAEAKTAVKESQVLEDRLWQKYASTPMGKLETSLGTGLEYLTKLLPTTFHNLKVDLKNLKSQKLVTSNVTVNGKKVSSKSKMTKEEADEIEKELLRKSKLRDRR